MGLAPAASMLLVPDAMLQFRRQRPYARVRIVEGVNTALVPLVRDETLDFCVGQRPTGTLDPALRFKPLLRTALIVVGRQGHPLRAARSLRELADASWLMFYPLGAGGMLEKAFGAAGLAMPRTIVQCESYAAALALLAKTDVLGLVVPQIFEQLQGPWSLRQIEVEEPLPPNLIGMYRRADAPLTPAASAMAQAVTSAARRVARAG
jgi:LysR family transcriptional regulator, regulator of abg operon